MREDDLFTVVVADDEEELLNAVCEMIPWEKIGFQLAGRAGNGLDALQLVEQLQPDLLLTDIRMPFINGINLARQVHELQPLTQIAFLSGYDDFEYAQKGIEYNVISYLLKPIDIQQLTEALQHIHEKIRKNYDRILPKGRQDMQWQTVLLSLLLDEYTESGSADQLRAKLIAAQVLPNYEDGAVFAVVATELQQDGENCTSYYNSAYTIDMVLKKYFHSRSVYSGGRILTLLVSEGAFGNLRGALDELIQSFRRVLSLRCCIGVSRTFSALEFCKAACREAVEAQRFAGDCGVFWYADLLQDAQEFKCGGADFDESLERLMYRGTETELQQYLHLKFMEAEGTVQKNILTIQILGCALRVLQTTPCAGETLRLWKNYSLPESLFTGMPDWKLQNGVSKFCEAVQKTLAESRKDGVRLLCTQALDAISSNYMNEDFSLSSVSEQLHVSPNYLSANMKKYAGDTFINLLIKKRMEVARELLTNGNLKIYEIAAHCGYSDQHYFSFCFKKYYGISPAQLRRSNAGGGGV